jgi:hypothetical protein
MHYCSSRLRPELRPPRRRQSSKTSTQLTTRRPETSRGVLSRNVTAKLSVELSWLTFQEACLARRRLIFSCHETCYQESLNSDEWKETNAASTNDVGVALSRFIPNIWENNTPVAGGLLQALLEEYSRRQLSYDTDMINAIQGVFSALNVRHCWGMPIEYLPGGTEVMLALNWCGVLATTTNLAGKETGFPSWSWASKKMQWKEFSKPSMSSQSLRIEVALADGAWLDADTYFRSHAKDNDYKLGRLIRVTGCVSRPSFVSEKWFGERAPADPYDMYSDLYAVLKRSDSGYWVYKVIQDVSRAVEQIVLGNEEHDVMALLVAEEDEASMGEYLLLVPSGTHYRRVGIARCPDRYDPTFTEADTLAKHLDSLQRFDSDFIARSTRRTIILE